MKYRVWIFVTLGLTGGGGFSVDKKTTNPLSFLNQQIEGTENLYLWQEQSPLLKRKLFAHIKR